MKHFNWRSRTFWKTFRSTDGRYYIVLRAKNAVLADFELQHCPSPTLSSYRSTFLLPTPPQLIPRPEKTILLQIPLFFLPPRVRPAYPSALLLYCVSFFTFSLCTTISKFSSSL